jgi:hypothetical protein
MDEVAQWIPEGTIQVVIDNLSIHSSVETLLWNFGHPRFSFHLLPTGAAWWTILGHWALEGRDFRALKNWERLSEAPFKGGMLGLPPLAGTLKSGNVTAGGSV